MSRFTTSVSSDGVPSDSVPIVSVLDLALMCLIIYPLNYPLNYWESNILTPARLFRTGEGS